MSQSINRRAAAGLLLSLPLLPALASTVWAAPSIARFIVFSAALTERPHAQLDAAMGERILAIVAERNWGPRLDALMQDRAADPELARIIVAAWYSGMMDGASGTVVVGYETALAWSSVAFLHCLGSCGGQTGYWADAPAP